MILSGRIVKNSKTLKEAVVEKNSENAPFRDTLEACLIELCRKLDVPVPIWLKKNTMEFVNFRKTTFNEDQFVEKVRFDRLEIKLE